MTQYAKYSLKSGDFEANLVASLDELRESNEFFDVTLVSDEAIPIQAHKVVLSASSIFFRNVLKNNKNTSPLLYIRGLTNIELGNVVEFLYKGEVTVEQENLEHFLRLSKDLKLKGLYENEEVNEIEFTKDPFKETSKRDDLRKSKKKDKNKKYVKVEKEEFKGKMNECIEDSSFRVVEFLQSPASDVRLKFPK